MNIGIGFDINHVDRSLIKQINILNIENPLYPGFLNRIDIESKNKIRELGFHGSIIVDGPYIDLNPGTPEPAIREVVRKKVLEAIAYAKSIDAEEIIFLSTYLPIIQVEFYDRGWIEGSIQFWKEITHKEKVLRISLCNTFEYHPDHMIEIIEQVNADNLGLAIDLGHVLAYGKIGIDEWYERIEKYIHTLYIHSNERAGDLHLNIMEGQLLKDPGFMRIRHRMKEKNLILKPFDKNRLVENISILKAFITG